MTDPEQKVEKVEKLDEPDVEGHRADIGRQEAGRADMGRADLGETEEADVEAHRFDKVEPRHDA